MKQILLTFLCLFYTASTQADAFKLTFSTDWKAQAEHGGFYQALAKGYYRDVGLDVTIRPGGPQTDNPRLLAAGALDIAMASNNFQPLNLVAAGVDIKVVMASFQKDPQVLMVHPKTGATRFADLVGKPIFISDSAQATFWPWLKAKFGYTDGQIRKYTYSLAPWLVNKSSVQEGYLSSEPYSAEQAGVQPQVMLFADEGYPGYSGMVIVRGDYLSRHPEQVKAFVKASIKGWSDFIWGDATAGSELIRSDNPEMTQDLINFAISKMKKNEMLGERSTIGKMTSERWNLFYEEMTALGLFKAGLDVDSAYTLDLMN